MRNHGKKRQELRSEIDEFLEQMMDHARNCRAKHSGMRKMKKQGGVMNKVKDEGRSENQKVLDGVFASLKARGFDEYEIVGLDSVVANKIGGDPMIQLGLSLGALKIEDVVRDLMDDLVRWLGENPDGAEFRAKARLIGEKNIKVWRETYGLA